MRIPITDGHDHHSLVDPTLIRWLALIIVVLLAAWFARSVATGGGGIFPSLSSPVQRV